MSTSVARDEPGAAGRSGAGPGGGGGRRWVAGRRSRLALTFVAALAVAAALAGVLTATAGSPRSLPLARNFSIPALGQPGQRVSLAALAGKPVVVNFFASWCQPCQRETPLLAKFYSSHRGKILVIGVDSADENAPAEKFVAAQHVTYPVGTDPFPSPASASYGVNGLPQTFFLNARHQVVRHVTGALTAADLNSWAATLAASQ